MLSRFQARSLLAARRLVNARSSPLVARARHLTTAVPDDKEQQVEKKSAWEMFKSDWTLYGPAAVLVGVPLIANEVLVLSEETQLLAVFVLFTGTIYTQLGGMIGKSLDEMRDTILKEQRAVEDVQIEQIQNAIEEHEKVLTLTEDFDQFLSVKDASRRLAVEAANYEAKHAFRASMIRKLEAVAATEETALQGIKGRMVDYVVNDVTTQFREDKKAKENALNQALAILGNTNAKMGKDVVGDAFVSSVKKYRTEYSKTPEDKDPILIQLKRDVEAIIKA